MLTKKNIALALSVLVVFVAGGWFFTSFTPRVQVQTVQESSVLDTPELMALEIISFSDAQDIGAEPVSGPQLAPDMAGEKQPLPASAPRQPVKNMPSQLTKIQVAGIAGVVSRSRTEEGPDGETTPSVLQVPVTAKPTGTMEVPAAPAIPGQESSISMIEAPVVYQLVKTLDEYKKFKTKAKGNYPKVDFNKEMLVVLESNSNLPDKVFEIESADVKDGMLEVLYRVNVFGLGQKINTHAVKTVKKTAAPVSLKQVL